MIFGYLGHHHNDGYTIQASQIKIEALSDTTDCDSTFPQKVVYLGSNGFLIAIMKAFAQHLPTFVFPEFSKQIKEHIRDKTHEAIATQFSTTTATAKTAREITLMAAMKNSFNYGILTCCGIPNITLLGKEQDWVALRARAEHLGSLMLPEFCDYWIPKILPVLDEFVESYKGKVNHGF